MRDSREDLCRTREASRELDSRGSSRGGRVGSFDRSQSPGDGEGGSAEKARPRVCKPWESRVQEQEVAPPPAGIRGRRRALYSPPMKRATVPPPVAPKPNLAARGRPASSPQTSPRLVRGTRATQLRQANSRKETVAANKPAAPRTISPRGSTGSPRGVSGQTPPRSQPMASSRSPKLSRHQEPGLVRQGTFTKDDAETASNVSSKRAASGSSIPSKKTPPKVPSKTNLFRKDMVSPSPTPRPLVSPRPTKTQTLREQSLSRGTAVRSSTSSSSSVVSRTSGAGSVRSMRTSSSSQSLRSAAESSALPRRVPSSSDIERRRTIGNSGMVTPQIRPSSSASAKAPGGRALSPATSLRQQGVAAAQPKRNVTSKIASLWKRVEDSKTKAKAEEGSKKYKPKDKRIWLGGDKGNQQQQQQE